MADLRPTTRQTTTVDTDAEIVAFAFLVIRRGELHVAEFGVTFPVQGDGDGKGGKGQDEDLDREALLKALCAAAAADMGLNDSGEGGEVVSTVAAAAAPPAPPAAAASSSSPSKCTTVVCPSAPLRLLRRIQGKGASTEADHKDGDSLTDGGWLFRAATEGSRGARALEALRKSKNFVLWRADSF